MRPKSLSGLLNWFSCKIRSIPVCTSPVPSSFSIILTVYEENIDLYIYTRRVYIYIYLAFEIQLQSTSAIKCRGNSTIFQFASAMRRQNILPKTQWKPFYITSAMASASAFCRSLWFGFLTVESTCST